MATVTVEYTGELSTRVCHEYSGECLITDAPKDHAGLGRSFAPTDLLASSIGAASLTYLAIRCQELGWEFPQGATADVEKVIAKEGPRRIGQLNITIDLGDHNLDSQTVSEIRWMVHSNPAVLSVKDSIIINYYWV